MKKFIILTFLLFSNLINSQTITDAKAILNNEKEMTSVEEVNFERLKKLFSYNGYDDYSKILSKFDERIKRFYPKLDIGLNIEEFFLKNHLRFATRKSKYAKPVYNLDENRKYPYIKLTIIDDNYVGFRNALWIKEKDTLNWQKREYSVTEKCICNPKFNFNEYEIIDGKIETTLDLVDFIIKYTKDNPNTYLSGKGEVYENSDSRQLNQLGQLRRILVRCGGKNGSELNVDKSKPDLSKVVFYEGIGIYEQNNKFGLVDIEGNIKLKAEYDKITDFNLKGVAIIENNNLFGLINKYGAIKLPIEYKNINEINYLFFVKNNTNLWNVYNSNITKINEFDIIKYKHLKGYAIKGLSESYYAVKNRDGQVGVYNNSFKEIIEPIYDDISYTFGYDISSMGKQFFGTDIYAFLKNKKWNYINLKTGKKENSDYDYIIGNMVAVKSLNDYKISDKLKYELFNSNNELSGVTEFYDIGTYNFIGNKIDLSGKLDFYTMYKSSILVTATHGRNDTHHIRYTEDNPNNYYSKDYIAISNQLDRNEFYFYNSKTKNFPFNKQKFVTFPYKGIDYLSIDAKLYIDKFTKKTLAVIPVWIGTNQYYINPIKDDFLRNEDGEKIKDSDIENSKYMKYKDYELMKN